MPQAVVNGLASHRRDPSSSPSLLAGAVANAEVLPRAQRRRLNADSKRRVRHEADQCRQHGQIGALLRREGLYSSHLSCWRQQQEHGKWAPFRGVRRLPIRPQERYPGGSGRIPGYMIASSRWKRSSRLNKLCDLPDLPSADPLPADSK